MEDRTEIRVARDHVARKGDEGLYIILAGQVLVSASVY